MKYAKILSKSALLLIFALSFNMAATAVSAQEMVAEETEGIIEGETTITPRGEVTGYKYKYINGVLYKRLCSYTNNCWIDEDWIRA